MLRVFAVPLFVRILAIVVPNVVESPLTDRLPANPNAALEGLYTNGPVVSSTYKVLPDPAVVLNTTYLLVFVLSEVVVTVVAEDASPQLRVATLVVGAVDTNT